MSQLLKIVLFLSLVLLLIFLVACVTTVNTSEDTTNSPIQTNASSIQVTPTDDEENVTQIQENDILIKLSTDKSTYVPGEVVTVTASVENLSYNPVEYRLSSLGDPTPYVWLESNPYFSGFALEEKELGGVRTVQPMISYDQLEPYSIVTREVIWDQMIFKDQQAPRGTYRIRCGITLIDRQNESSPRELSANLDIFIYDSPEWITPEEAKKIALDLPEVKTWLEAHSGKNVVKEENGYVFIYLADEWVKLSPYSEISKLIKTLSLDEQSKWIPDDYSEYTTFENGIWAIRIATKYGTTPHFIRIQIDPVTSSVIEIKFSDRSPL